MGDWYQQWLDTSLPQPISAGEKAARRAEYMHRYYLKNRDRLTAYHKEYNATRRKPRAKKPEHEYKSCVECGAPFQPYHLSDKYCCKSCRERAMSRIKYARKKTKRAEANA